MKEPPQGAVVVTASTPNRRASVRLCGLLLLGVAAAWLLASWLPSSASAQTTATRITVAAGSPSEFRFKLSKLRVPAGVVTFVVTNRGHIPHDFRIAGKQTRLLQPHRSQTLRVTFKKAGSYRYLCTVSGHAAAGMKGTLRVTATRPHLRATRVTVTAGSPSEFRFKLSRTTVRPGVVTFVVTNRGHLVHDFKIAGRKTALLKPGKRATIRVTFKKAGSYRYLCTVSGHAAAGMKGTLRVR